MRAATAYIIAEKDVSLLSARKAMRLHPLSLMKKFSSRWRHLQSSGSLHKIDGTSVGCKARQLIAKYLSVMCGSNSDWKQEF